MIGSFCGRAQSKTSASAHDVILLAVDDDRVGWHVLDRKPLHRRADQDQALRRHRHVRRASGRRSRTRIPPARAALRSHRRELALGERQRGERVGGLADAVSKVPSLLPDAAKVEAYAGVTQCGERAGEGLRDLVVQRAALQRMRDVRPARCRAARPRGRSAQPRAHRPGRRSLERVSPRVKSSAFRRRGRARCANR